MPPILSLGPDDFARFSEEEDVAAMARAKAITPRRARLRELIKKYGPRPDRTADAGRSGSPGSELTDREEPPPMEFVAIDPETDGLITLRLADGDAFGGRCRDCGWQNGTWIDHPANPSRPATPSYPCVKCESRNMEWVPLDAR